MYMFYASESETLLYSCLLRGNYSPLVLSCLVSHSWFICIAAGYYCSHIYILTKSGTHSTSPRISNFYFAVEVSARRSSSLQILQPQSLQVHKLTSACNPHDRLLQLLRDLCTRQTNHHHLHFFLLFTFADVRKSQRQK